MATVIYSTSQGNIQLYVYIPEVILVFKGFLVELRTACESTINSPTMHYISCRYCRAHTR